MTIRGLLEKWAAKRPDSVALRYCEDKVWKTRSYGEFLRGVREIAEGYGARFGLQPRDENVAVIVNVNHAHESVPVLGEIIYKR